MKARPIEIAPAALAALRRVRPKRLQLEVALAIDSLARDPERQGKALSAPLEDLRAVKAARDRYRVIYRVDEEAVRIVHVGPRRPGRPSDVYEVARKLLAVLLKG